MTKDSDVDKRISMAKQYANTGKWKEAEEVCLEVLEFDPENAEAVFTMGVIASWTKNHEVALIYFKEAIERDPLRPEYYLNLGITLFNLNQNSNSLQAIEEAIRLDPELGLAYVWKGLNEKAQHDLESAELSLKKAIDLGVTDIDFGALSNSLGTALMSQNKIEESIEIFEQAYRLNNRNSLAFIAKELAIPIVYESEDEIEFYRESYTKGLQNLVHHFDLQDKYTNKSLVDVFSSYGNHYFYLPYQGFNDYDLQKTYGSFIHQLMSIAKPHHKHKLEMRVNSQFTRRIKVGYISSWFYNHTVAKLTKGWFDAHNREIIEIHSYYTTHNNKQDEITDYLRERSDFFNVFNVPPIDLVAEKIKEDKLDILVYLEIGMWPAIYLLASLRLAPIQCVFWGHPQTTGLPTIDYFLSCELMESDTEERVYTEKRVNLPKIGVCYHKPEIPKTDKGRSYFGLNDDSIVYLSCQSLYKYLPKYDDIFANIASKVGNSQFAFLQHKYKHINDQFTQRLSNAFAKNNLDWQKYCILIRRLSQKDYLILNCLSDIYLDTIGWSGGNTTMEAIACGLPVVTYPGKLMRSRHSYGILMMIGMKSTIAYSQEDYIQISIKLGLDLEYREEIKRLMLEKHEDLYDDREAVRGLERFYLEAVDKFYQ